MTGENNPRYSTITFRPSQEVANLLEIATSATGSNRSEIINSCLKKSLGEEINSRIQTRTKAIDEFNKLQDRSTPDQTAGKMAKRASERIKKKRKKG